MDEITIKLKKLHVNQEAIIKTAKRFNVLKCGRRFGKTELTKELTIEPAIDGKIVGYWTPTYKDVNKVWDDLKYTLAPIIKSKDEQLKQIKLITGGSIDLWSLESPDNGRGFSYDRAIIDEAEKARHLKNAWEQTIRGTLVDRQGDAWFMSTPKFGETYFKEVLFKNYLDKKDWMSWRYTSFDNPLLKKEEIESARMLLDSVTFDCEYMALDVDVTLRPFLYQWNDTFINNNLHYDFSKQLIISVDFNLVPFCVTFHNFYADENGWHWLQFDEAEMVNGSIPAMIELIKTRYGSVLSTAIITGDFMGKRGSIEQADNASLYIQLIRGLGMRESQLALRSNPTHEKSRNEVNYVFCHMKNISISNRCVNTIRDYKNVQIDANGEIIKSYRKDINQRADYLDTIRYLVHNIMHKWIEHHQKTNFNINTNR